MTGASLRPWLGLASFTEAEAGRFFGREEELAELLRRVQRKRLTVLFGQSGLGKTSLLQAGLGPRAQAVGLLPVRVRMDYAPEAPSPAEQIKQAIAAATQGKAQWTQVGVAAEGETLWAFLHHRDDQLQDADGRQLRPLLVFDQFEEVFTLGQADAARRAQAERFITELADLVENRVPAALEAAMEQDEGLGDVFDFARDDYRALISLREDYLAPLESLKGRMPSLTQNRLRLEPLRGAQALQAVRGPAPDLVEAATAEGLLRFVAGMGPDRPLAEVSAEPSLLSLFLYELNEQRIARGDAQISDALLEGSQASILRDFYERSLADQPAGVRRFVEDRLLTDTGYRDSVSEERARQSLSAAGAAPEALAQLVDRRLLRVEERGEQRRVELTHDVLAPVVRASRDSRLERERAEAAERQAAERQAAEQQALAEAARSRRALVKARWVAGGAAVLASVALLGGAMAYRFGVQAERAEALAQKTRSDAQAVMGFLQEDFQKLLAPIGRHDISKALNERVLRYYDDMPAEARTRESQIRHALVLEQASAVLTFRSDWKEADAALTRAEQLLQSLPSGGAGLEADRRLAEANVFNRRADLIQARGDGDEAALPASQRAVAAIQPLVDAPQVEAAVRLRYIELLNRLAYRNGRVSDFPSARETAERALAQLALLPSEAAPALERTLLRVGASRELSAALRHQELWVEADQAADAALQEVRALREKEAGDARLESAESSLLHDRAQGLLGTPQVQLAARQALEAVQMRQRAAARNPGDGLAANLVLYSSMGYVASLIDQGEVAKALQVMDNALTDVQKVKPNYFIVRNGVSYAVHASRLHFDRGDLASAKRLLALARRFQQQGAALSRKEALVLGSRVASGAWLLETDSSNPAALADVCQVPDASANENLSCNRLRAFALLDGARLRGDAAAVEAAARLGVKVATEVSAKWLADVGVVKGRLHAYHLRMLAWAQAKQGRLDEARQSAATAWQRFAPYAPEGDLPPGLQVELLETRILDRLLGTVPAAQLDAEIGQRFIALPADVRKSQALQWWMQQWKRGL